VLGHPQHLAIGHPGGHWLQSSLELAAQLVAEPGVELGALVGASTERRQQLLLGRVVVVGGPVLVGHLGRMSHPAGKMDG
jgi:hypothetical protein